MFSPSLVRTVPSPSAASPCAAARASESSSPGMNLRTARRAKGRRMTVSASQWLLEARRNIDLARVTRELYNLGWAAYIRGSSARICRMPSLLRRVILLSFLPAVLLAQGPRMTGLTAGINFSTLGGAYVDGDNLDGRVGLAVVLF